MIRHAFLFGLVGLGLLAGCAKDRIPRVEAVPAEEIAAEDARNLKTDGHFFLSGVLTEDGLAELRGRGVETVLDLRESRQIPEGYPETVRRLGLAYVSAPLRSNGMNATEAEAALAELDRARDWPVLVQCGSGNRVGALYGLYHAKQAKLTVEEALDLARKAGMRDKDLQADVETLLRDTPEEQQD